MRSSARLKNAAIWPLVTLSFGQNRSLSGGLQPRVIPAVPIRSISASKIDVSSSVNKSAPAPAVRPSALVRKAAIWPRVTSSSGQKRSPASLQPKVIPLAAIHSMSASKIEVSSSVNVPPAAWTVIGAMTAIIIAITKATNRPCFGRRIVRCLYTAGSPPMRGCFLRGAIVAMLTEMSLPLQRRSARRWTGSPCPSSYTTRETDCPGGADALRSVRPIEIPSRFDLPPAHTG